MDSERDLRENERTLIPSWYPPLEHQSQQISQGTPFKPCLEDLAAQAIEVEDDPESAAIVDQLRETSSYAINPTFKEELRKELLQQFVAHHTVETKPIEGMDDILSKERNVLLSDLGNRLPITEKRKSLEQAFQEEGLQLHIGAPHSYENKFKHKFLLLRAYKHIIRLLWRFH
jgi:hypothetical protein